jgi:xylulokinase
VCAPPEIADVTRPEPALAEAFALQHERFQSLYRALKPEFARRGAATEA